MSNKLTTLDQLKRTAQEAQGFASEVAAQAAAAIEEQLGTAVAVTLAASGWTLLDEGLDDETEDVGAGYPYAYDIPVAGLTVKDRADVTFLPASTELAAEYGVCPATESLAGKIRLRALKQPEVDLLAEYWINIGKE